jgi:hypothetical protein
MEIVSRIQKYLPGKRYVCRELIPRALLLTATFKWLMPLTRLFHFNGSWIAAPVFGVLFTGMFMFFGSYIAGLPSVERFLIANKNTWWLPCMNIALLVLVPAAALSIAALVAPAIFSMNWLYGWFVGSVILNFACIATHDYGASRNETD